MNPQAAEIYCPIRLVFCTLCSEPSVQEGPKGSTALSGTVATRKRLLRITAGNIRNSHIYIANHIDFFPEGCVGAPRRAKNGTNGHSIRIQLVGLNKTVERISAANVEAENHAGCSEVASGFVSSFKSIRLSREVYWRLNVARNVTTVFIRSARRRIENMIGTGFLNELQTSSFTSFPPEVR